MIKQAVLHTWHIWSRWSDDWHVLGGHNILQFHGAPSHQLCENLRLVGRLVNRSSHDFLRAIMPLAVMQMEQSKRRPFFFWGGY